MKLAKYKDVLALSKEETQNAQAPFRVKEMHKRAELEALEIEAAIASKESCIHQLTSQYPVDYEELIHCLNEVALLKRKHEQFNDIITQMFDMAALPAPHAPAAASPPVTPKAA
jgi:hypothetical protein